MINKKLGLIALLASLAGGELVQADLTSYTTGDVLVCFRATAGGNNDLVVDAGPISTFTNLTANQRYSITTYTGTQLASVGTNNISWSAFTWLANNTLFVTKPRTKVNSQSSPWKDSSAGLQAGTIQQMSPIPPGALDSYNLDIYPNSTPTAVIEQESSTANPNYPDGLSYHDCLFGSYGGGTSATFDGYFQGNPESSTTNNFTKAGTVVRSDFYRLSPTSANNVSGIYLGYFELNTNGALTYVAYPTATPSINSISRTGNVTTITYTTGTYGTYTLRATSSLTPFVAETSWTAVSTLLNGTTATQVITDTNSAASRFYTITAQ